VSTTSTDPAALEAAKALAARCMRIMGEGSLADFEEVVHPDCVNREAATEPPAARGRGPAALHATAIWLRDAWSDFGFDIHEIVAEGDLVALHCTMTGTHDGTFVLHDGDGRVETAYPATGRSFAVTHSHWFRVAEGKVIEHWANRDDLLQGLQLGWFPPSAEYMAEVGAATARARAGRS
jgi:predicted ester cyclase